MKYLVTGGAGFIGSNLVDALLGEGHEVVVLDNLSTGKRENLNPRADFHEVDISDFNAIKPFFDGIDGVFHVAALPRIPRSIEAPQETHQANVVGTLNVLVAARDAAVKRVVYSASSSAYGNQPKLPVTEDLPPSPLNPYALQKLTGEYYAKLFYDLYGLETVSLRYFNVYGPRMASDGAYATVIGVFLRQKKAGESLTITGDGEQTRDFTHVKDVVRANLMAMNSGNAGHGEIINVGAGSDKSVNEVARMIGGSMVNLPARPGEILRNRADISLAGKLLGWRPQADFAASVAELKKMNGVE
ncbi:NAD-dependent epimerase/dehydratase family protein [Candidatus Uhrbacteria bacterium]|nr:NAD-dependent epimerase/dehydratase family protein [Candidatus Uhrbacteria bacterium]